ncbi:MAG: hypothetical protein DRI77_11145, partial [Chloroflexi bacterium]
SSGYSIGWMSWDVTNIVQGWASGVLLNHGILLRPGSGEYGAADFFTRDSSAVPRLTIYYESAPCEPATDASISGPTQGITDTTYTFAATVSPPTASPPFTYTWYASQHSKRVTTTSSISSTASYVWTTSGLKKISVLVQNCDSSITATHNITIETPSPTCSVPMTKISVAGPTGGITGTAYTFTTTVFPSNATPPFTYTWQTTEQSDVQRTGSYTQTAVTFTWDAPGRKRIIATAGNCGGDFVTYRYIDILAHSQLPDLTISSAWYESDYPRVGYLIENAGGSTAAAGHVTGMYQGVTPLATDTVTYTLQAGAIRAGYLDQEWELPPPAVSGLVKLCADDTDVIVEGDEDDNCWEEWWPADLKLPEIISGPTVLTTTEHTAVIAWQTDEPCSSRVDYSRWRYMTPSSTSDPAYETDHQITLTGLENGSTYYYQVFASDESGNEVNSAEQTFETLTPGGDPPAIESIGLAEYPAAYYEFYTAWADLASADYVDRVEFYLDGALLGTDYEPVTPGGGGSPRYEVHFSPHAEGMTRADFFQPHTLEARAFSIQQVMSTKSDTVSPSGQMEADVTIVSPNPDHNVYIDADVAPAGTALNVTVRASEYEWGCTYTGFSEQNPPGIPVVMCDDVEQAVEQIELFFDDQSAATYSLAAGEFLHTFDLDLTGEPLGDHTLRVVARTSEGNTVETSRDFSIVRGQPSLEFERQVTRNDNVFEVALTIENAGAGTAYLDFIWDIAAGFQVIEGSTAKGLYAVSQAGGDYTIKGRDYAGDERLIEIEFFDGGDDYITLPPGESFTAEYTLVPILYEDPIDRGIGYTADPTTQSYVQYSDATDTYAEYFVVHGSTVNDPEAGIASRPLDSAFIAACAEADYLLVTSPLRLTTHAADINWRVSEGDQREQSRLLSRMAELASLQNGVLAFLSSSDPATLDALLEPGGMWADALHPNFRQAGTGYVLFVGESEIVPTQSGGYGVDYSDLRYASTVGAARPELVLGRVVGNDMGTLRKVLEASVTFHRLGYNFDRSDAVLVSGRGEGEGTFWNDVKAVSNIIDDEFTVTKIRWKNHPGNYLGVLADATPNQDVIMYRGHGNAGVWKKNGEGINVYDVASLDFGSARPFVFALACTTGDYEGNGDYSMADAFLRQGAAVYIGSVETSSRSRNSNAARGFFNRWDAARSIGDALNDLMRDKWGDSSWLWTNSTSWERWIYDYQLFGDPRFGATSAQSAAAQSFRPDSDLALQGQTTLQVLIPDFDVTAMDDGWDDVRI